MAQFKYAYYVAPNGSRRFDHVSPKGAPAPHAGIYFCEGCAREVALARGDPLPGDGDHEHANEQGSIRWRLIVAAS